MEKQEITKQFLAHAARMTPEEIAFEELAQAKDDVDGELEEYQALALAAVTMLTAMQTQIDDWKTRYQTLVDGFRLYKLSEK